MLSLVANEVTALRLPARGGLNPLESSIGGRLLTLLHPDGALPAA
jgi:hypothetical protein